MALYATHNCHPVHKLFYTWSGWPSEGSRVPTGLPVGREMSVFPPEPGNDFFAKLAALWKSDGLTLLTRNWQPDLIQLAFAVTPDVAPTFFTHRVKGRLQHALREAGTPVDFSRKASMRAIGENITDVVENYLAHQTARGDFADNRYRDMLQAESFEEDALDLADPVEVKRGRYWYNLHLVLVTADRFRMGKEDFALKLRAATQSAAADNGCRVKAFALMPDHVHIAMRGNVERSPVELGVAFQNALTKVAGCRLWDYRFYVGTFSEYGIKKILR